MPTYEELNYDNNLNKADGDALYNDSTYNNESDILESDESAQTASTASGSYDPLDTTDDTTPITSVSKLTSGVFQAAEFIVEASGRIRSGQTAYDTGIGWWIGDVAGTKKLSIGNSAGNKLTWDGTTLSISGSLVAGDISIGTSPNWFRVDSSGNTWWGAVLFADAPASVTPAGLATFNSASIGGWNVVSGYIYNLQSGTPTSSPSDGIVMASGNEAIMVYEDTAKRVELGYLSAGVYGLKGYATNGTDVVFELSDTQQKIAGFYFTDTVLRSNTTDASSNIFLDSANSLIRAGATTGNYISIDGANLRIRSSNYVSGSAGAGFTLEPNLLEVGNIACRGIFRTAVFQKDVISAISGGVLIVPNNDVLATDMTALDAETVTIEGNVSFAVNDILRIKDVANDEWMKVLDISGAPTYVVQRDRVSDYASDANPTWKKGASVLNYGSSGGGIFLTASGANAPYLSVFSHTGFAWTPTTELRIGNLNGYLGYVADTYGLGVGSSASGKANITIDSTNGIRIRQGTTNKITFDNSGNATLLNLDVQGALTVGTSGSIGSGQTAYDTGTGWWWEYNGGSPRFSLGNPATSYLRWTSSALEINGKISLTSGSIIDGGYITSNTVIASKLKEIFDDRDGSVAYTGSWSQNSIGTHFFGTSTYSATIGDYFEITFTGTDIILFFERATSAGQLEIKIDGSVDTAALDLYSVATRPRSIGYSKSGLADTSHTLRATILTTFTGSGRDTIFDGYSIDPNVALSMQNLACEIYSVSYSVTTNANGYYQLVPSVPSGYVSLGCMSATLFSAVLDSAAANKPKIATRHDYICLYDGAAATSYSVNATFVVFKY